MKLNSGLPSQHTSLHEETEQKMKLNNGLLSQHTASPSPSHIDHLAAHVQHVLKMKPCMVHT